MGETTLEAGWDMIHLGMIGDALGAPVEFRMARGLEKFCGESGLVEKLYPAFGDYPVITDDTQMLLFTLEAMLFWDREKLLNLRLELVEAYHRWYDTQKPFITVDGHSSKIGILKNKVTLPHDISTRKGYLARDWGMYASRAPGMSCLDALRKGKTTFPSKGAGGVMRVAPLALMNSYNKAQEAAQIAACITHTHIDGWLPAKMHVAILHQMLHQNISLYDAAYNVLDEYSYRKDTETWHLLNKALILGQNIQGTKAKDFIVTLGEGWTGSEALAIAVFCALAGETTEQCLSLAVTHKGDSDTTGAICGQLVGASPVHSKEVSWQLIDQDYYRARQLFEAWVEKTVPPLSTSIVV